MAEGTIKRITDRGFGFIDTGSGEDLFFHMSGLEGVTFEELREGPVDASALTPGAFHDVRTVVGRFLDTEVRA